MTDHDLLNDVDLTPDDIGVLENAERINQFLAELRYNADNFRAIDLDSLGMDTANLSQEIFDLWLVARDPEDEEIVFYVATVRSVTQKLLQDVGRKLKERPDTYIFIFIDDDFDTLHFVFYDFMLAPNRSTKRILRLRKLQVKRREIQNNSVELRVLKRFTFTEPDAPAQIEKIRSAYTVAEWSEEYFNNRALFSDHYLNTRVRATDEWLNPDKTLFRQLAQQVATAQRDFSKEPESVIRANYFEPLWEQLGFAYQELKSGKSSDEEPDYALFADENRDTPIAWALTYVWNRNLDGFDDQRDLDTPDEVPGSMVVSLLEKENAPPWIIVTNGKLWRLYSSTTSNNATNYYEIELVEAANAPDQMTALNYWWLFFRKEAFTGFLDEVLQRSEDYATDLRKRLKKSIFEDIFPEFAKGFVADMQAQGVTLDDAALQKVFKGTMTFLYRLMFILYAESLDLLPLYDRVGYRENSLYRLKNDIARVGEENLDKSIAKLTKYYNTRDTTLYARLAELFAIIDEGSADHNIPTYNGGLFNPTTPTGEFLANYAIPDGYLARGLDRLARDEDDKTHELVMVDFKSLGVRHLGSVYEGLLEFKLEIAAENLIISKSKGKEVFTPAKNKTPHIKKGEVYLTNDKKERKATGSYYTPDYIVKYIVEHTVGPVLERKFADLRERLNQTAYEYHQFKRNMTARNHPNETADKFWNTEKMQQLVDDCLNIRVLDPAMGSGHFLVEVVDFVSNRLIDFLNGWSENPVWHYLERTRQDIVEDLEKQGVSVDVERLTRVTLLKRAVLKRVIYGVDLNEMAVELAKVSLWLNAFTLGAPLSFLDHHLKYGNSLIGARVKEVQDYITAAGQMDMFATNPWTGVMLATDMMRQVSYLSDNTVAQIEESKHKYQSARDNLAPYKHILDIYTSRWFSNSDQVKKKTDNVLLLLKQQDIEDWLKDPEFKLNDSLIPANKMAQNALTDTQAKHFFHWELEFPEVFFAPSKPGGQDVQLREDGGFDAVVGNPPYLDIKGLEKDFVNYSTERFEFSEMRINIYANFIENMALSLINQGGVQGLIIPTSFLTQVSYNSLRTYLLEKQFVREIVRLPNEVFGLASGEVKVDTVIFINQNSTIDNSNVTKVLVYEGFIRQGLIDATTSDFSFNLNQKTWLETDENHITFVRPDELNILRKIESDSLNLEDLCEFCLGITPYDKYRGHTKEQISNKVFHGTTKIDDTYKKLLVSGDVNRYITKWNGVEWIKYGEWLAAPREQRFFTQERILVQQIIDWTTERIQCAYTNEELYNTQNQFNLLPKKNVDLKYILAVLNSNLMSFYHRKMFLDIGLQRFQKILIKDARKFPIRRLSQHLHSQKNIQLERRYVDEDIDGIRLEVDELIKEKSFDEIEKFIVYLVDLMIQLHKERDIEAERFLGWLEDTLKIKPSKDKTGWDVFKGKTFIQNYLGDYQKGEEVRPWDKSGSKKNSFYAVLHDNRNRFHANLDDVAPEIKREYEKSLAKLIPIKEQLARTDALIDQIVYKLYGLTDEEIELIERPQYEQALTSAKEAVQDKDIPDDEKLSEIGDEIAFATTRYIEVTATEAAQANLDANFPQWRDLPERLQKMLISAEKDYMNDMRDDYTGSLVNYAKVVEITLNQRLFIPFRDANYDDKHVDNKVFKKFMRNEIPGITLGSVEFLLTSQEKAFRQYILTLYPNAEHTIFDKTQMRSKFTKDEIRRRNQATHNDLVPHGEAEATRIWTFEILEYLL